jgi:gentisate 1,2-dioxygenase
MSFNITPPKWKKNYGSSTYPELIELFQRQLAAKKKSRIVMKKKDIQWDNAHPQSRSATLVDARGGFATTFVNVGISEIAPRNHTGKHKHTEAVVYILGGRGYSIIGGKRYPWEQGDTIYIPPDTFHQHYNTGNETVQYLRIVPGPAQINLLSMVAALNFFPSYNMEVAELQPKYSRKSAEKIKSYMRGART